MRKLTIFFVLFFLGLMTNAQEKSGTVFIEHPVLEKVNQLWNAFEQGDQSAFGNLLADSVWVITNGNRSLRTREAAANGLKWWAEEFEDLKVVADTPAYADVLEYDKGGLWVQDWLRMKGLHTKSGIRLNLPVHNLYSFNEDGQISSLHRYFDPQVFEEINTSQTTQENGKVYINHPYIVQVRKLLNAYCEEDIPGMMEFYTDDAVFYNTTMKYEDQRKLGEQKKEWESIFEQVDHIEMEQVGYPDCIYYAKNDDYVVYSWWIFSGERGEEKIEFPLMLSHTFNDDGKIVNSMGYYSSNHYE
jgi:ketosteroid isomerase-like protein